MAKDFLRSAITARLAPMLAAAGFVRHAPKTFVRVRGALVDHVAFNPSRVGRGFYVQYGIELAANPVFAPDRARVGDVLDDWNAAETYDDASAQFAIEGVARAIARDVLPWLDERRTVRDFVAERYADPNSAFHSMDVAIALALMGAVSAASRVCATIRDPASYLHELSERERRQMELATELLDALDGRRGSVGTLITGWRAANLERHSLVDPPSSPYLASGTGVVVA